MVGGTTGSPTCTARAPGLLGNATGWYVQSGYYLIPRKVEAAARFAYWDPDTHSGGDLVKEVDVSLNWFLNDTYDHSIMLEYYNIQMGMGGYLLGRSNPLPSVSGAVALDPTGPLLIENGIRLQYQIFSEPVSDGVWISMHRPGAIPRRKRISCGSRENRAKKIMVTEEGWVLRPARKACRSWCGIGSLGWSSPFIKG